MPPVPTIQVPQETGSASDRADFMPANTSGNASLAPPAPSQPTRRSLPNIFGGGGADGRKGLLRSTRRSSEAAVKTPKMSATESNPQGHEGNLTAEQQKTLDAFTNELVAAKLISLDNAPPYQTTQLLRFLRARNFDLKAATEMYKRTEEWRKNIDIDRLYEDFAFDERPQVSKFGWRMYYHKTDRMGRPIFIQDLSGLEADKVFSVTSAERIVQNFAVTLEHAVRHRYQGCSIAKGRMIDDNLMILNIQGLGLSTFWSMKNKLQELLSILDNNFPELSGRVQIINAPMLFSTVWSCVKGWLPAHTTEKIDICDSDYLPTIRSLVDMENWPKHLGGTCTCGAHDSRPSCEISDAGPWPKQPNL